MQNLQGFKAFFGHATWPLLCRCRPPESGWGPAIPTRAGHAPRSCPGAAACFLAMQRRRSPSPDVMSTIDGLACSCLFALWRLVHGPAARRQNEGGAAGVSH